METYRDCCECVSKGEKKADVNQRYTLAIVNKKLISWEIFRISFGQAASTVSESLSAILTLLAVNSKSEHHFRSQL